MKLVMWMTSCPEATGWDSLWFWIKAVSWDLNLDEANWFFGPGRGQSSLWTAGCAACCRVRWNSQHSKNCVSLSPRVKYLKVKKVIKVSYLNQESHQCFACFSDSYAYKHSMNICTFHISVSWLCYKLTVILRPPPTHTTSAQLYRYTSRFIRKRINFKS